MGIGDWGLGIGDWGVENGPKPHSPITNPQSPKYQITLKIDDNTIYFKANNF